MAETLENCIDNAKASLIENLEGGENYLRRHGADSIVSDGVHECADSAVPVYTGDLLRIAAEDTDLATKEPEVGPAFDGSPTPANIIAANIYEAVTAALYEYASELEDENRMCQADNCDDETDHWDDDVDSCKKHCGGPDECPACEVDAHEEADAAEANTAGEGSEQ